MTGILDDAPADITCEQCGHKFEALVREINAQVQLTCPNCVQLMNTDQARAQLTAYEEVIADFARSLGGK